MCPKSCSGRTHVRRILRDTLRCLISLISFVGRDARPPCRVLSRISARPPTFDRSGKAVQEGERRGRGEGKLSLRRFNYEGSSSPVASALTPGSLDRPTRSMSIISSTRHPVLGGIWLTVRERVLRHEVRAWSRLCLPVSARY